MLWNQAVAAEWKSSEPFRYWLQVLARPAIFHALTRPVSRAHLLTLLDTYRTYARLRAMDEPAILPALEQMQTQMSDWTPPELPVEIIEAARALLVVDGFFADFNWEKLPTLSPGETVESLVVWPPDEAGPR